MMRDQKLWTWHLAAGVVILILLGLHMTIMHLNGVIVLKGLNPAGGHPIDWGNVASRARNGFFMVTYVILLGAALFHGLYGLRTLLFELDPARWLKRAISGLLLGGGVALFVIGTWAAIVARSM